MRAGKCESCGGWNTITQEGAAPPIGANATRRAKGRRFALEDLKSDEAPPQRRITGIKEFDRVTGGGLVPGSALLVGGDPGIGKSTLILQALGAYAKAGGSAVYISGEEALAQVRMRAARLEPIRCAACAPVRRRAWKTFSPPLDRSPSRQKEGRPASSLLTRFRPSGPPCLMPRPVPSRKFALLPSISCVT